jgi:membrane-bound ClpP family serine protease
MKNMRLILAVLSSLLDEVLILFILLWGLPKLGIELPIPFTIIIVVLFAVFAVTTFKLGTKALKMKPMAGLTDMTGVEGRVVKKLAPIGYVIIKGELWESRSLNEPIDIGIDVIVLSQRGLKLVVRKK